MKHSIVKKISGWVTLLLLLITLFGNVFVYYYFRDRLVDGALTRNEATLTVGAAQLESICSDIRSIMQAAAINSNAQKYFRSGAVSDDFDNRVKLGGELRDFVRLRAYIQSISLTAESDVLWSAFPMDHYMERAMQEPWYT
ncbi:MAG: hypothetical protein RR209_03045, partial [Angelakisella sp.]